MDRWINLVNQDNTKQHHDPPIIYNTSYRQLANPYLIDIIFVQCPSSCSIIIEVIESIHHRRRSLTRFKQQWDIHDPPSD